MFVKITKRKHGKKTYRSLLIVRNKRVKGKVVQETLASFGNPDKLTSKDIDSITKGLKKAIGELVVSQDQVFFESALDFGDIYLVNKIWEQLGMDEIIHKLQRKTKFKFDLSDYIKVMVINRLSDPKSKLGIFRWLEGVHIPGIDKGEIHYENILRAMDFLHMHKKEIEEFLYEQMKTLFDLEVTVVFYDVTSSYVYTEMEDDGFRRLGFSRDRRRDLKQICIGLVITQEGIPIMHRVFPGNQPDKTTVAEVVSDLNKHFKIGQCIFVGDRGMLTKDNIELLESLEIPYILAIPRRNNLLLSKHIYSYEQALKEARKKEGKVERLIHELLIEEAERFDVDSGECEDNGDQSEEVELKKKTRLIFEYSQSADERHKRIRTRQLEAADKVKKKLLRRLKSKKNKKGRPLTQAGAIARFSQYLGKRRIRRFYHLDHIETLDEIKKDRTTLLWENAIDGMLAVITTASDLTKEQVIEQYRDLSDIERCFRLRSLKTSFDLRPIHHWTKNRIKAHVHICVLALLVSRIIRRKLRKSDIKKDETIIMEKLKTIRAVEASINGETVRGITRVREKQLSLFDSMEVPPPTPNDL